MSIGTLCASIPRLDLFANFLTGLMRNFRWRKFLRILGTQARGFLGSRGQRFAWRALGTSWTILRTILGQTRTLFPGSRQGVGWSGRSGGYRSRSAWPLRYFAARFLPFLPRKSSASIFQDIGSFRQSSSGRHLSNRRTPVQPP